MNKINSFYNFLIIIFIGIIGFFLAYFFHKITFFSEHENLLFVTICFICAVIYGLIFTYSLEGIELYIF